MSRTHRVTVRTPLLALATLGLIACGGITDAPGSAPASIVGDGVPLPVPSNTMGPPDLVTASNGKKIVVGTLAGTSSISDDGVAHYSIPLWVSPGRAGMQPELALDYDSRAPNGLLGVGWSLSGFSQITRCAHTVASDGVAGAVKFDATDDYCLDGQHLKPIGNFSAGKPAYRTEYDTFALAVAESADAFTVYQRNGRIFRYSGQKLGRTVSAVWALTRIEDRYGNTIDYTYIDNDKNALGIVAVSYLYPDTISYTGSTSGTPTPSRLVKFKYESRTDAEYSAAAGQTLLLKRLQRIEVNGPDGSSGTTKSTLLRAYTLDYGSPTSITARSRLASVTASDGQNNALAATTFQWSQGTAGYTRSDSAVTDYLANIYHGGYRLIDLDGDGYADLFYVVKGPNGDPEYAVRFYQPGIGDFGSRFDWLIKPITDYSGVYTFPMPALSDANTSLGVLMWETLAGSSGFAPVMQQVQPLASGIIDIGYYNAFPGAVNVAFPADFDGDGLADVVTGEVTSSSLSTFRIYRNLGKHPAHLDGGTAVQVNMSTPTMVESGAIAPFRGVDLDGDGRQEITVCYPAGATGYAGMAVVAIDHTYPNPGALSCANRPVFVDFNGDGLDDTLALGAKYDKVSIGLNSGPRTLLDSQLGGPGGAITNAPDSDPGSQAITTDYDLDGHPDIVLVGSQHTTDLRLFRSTNTRSSDLVESGVSISAGDLNTLPQFGEIGRASCRERV